MSINYLNNNLDDRKGQNITNFSSQDTFSLQDPTNLELVSHSSYDSSNGYGSIDTKEALETITGEQIDEVPDSGGNNWGADLINAPTAWNEGYTGEGVVVAVIDGGVDYNHQDLQDNIWTNSKEIAGNGKDDDGNGFVDDVYGWNFHDNNNDTLDRDGHGTHVAGTIAGVNNDYGVTGIAYDAQIMSVKVLDDSGSGYYSSIVDGIYYAVDNGADVINLSLGGEYPSWDVDLAIAYAHESGVNVIMAAGNNSGETPLYPASYADNYGIAVGAVDRNDELADFSNRAGNDEINYVTAPGVNIYSTVPNNGYEFYSGTSMAAPHVSGMVALMLSADPTLTPDQISEIITQSATNNTEVKNSDDNILGLDFDLDLAYSGENLPTDNLITVIGTQVSVPEGSAPIAFPQGNSNPKPLEINEYISLISFANQALDSFDTIDLNFESVNFESVNFESVNFGANNNIDFASNLVNQAGISNIIENFNLSTLSNLSSLDIDFANNNFANNNFFNNNNNLLTNPILSNPAITSELLNLYRNYLDVMTSIDEITENYNPEELPEIPSLSR